MQLLIYCDKITPRIAYIFSVLLPASGIAYDLTLNKQLYSDSTTNKLNYSDKRISEDELWIQPLSLLFETDIKEQQPLHCFPWQYTKAFFKTTESDFPFDIFAASFYLLSRYEEYLPHKTDMYGRYAHENSIAWREGFLHLPLINIWLKEFTKALQKKFPQLHTTPPSFHFLPTYDIDIAWSYLHKGFMRNAGGLIKSMVKGEWSRVQERMRVLLGVTKDPFDSYEWLHELHDKYGTEPLYFFLVAQQNNRYDKNILPVNTAMRKLIKQHSTKYETGIHPSWQSGDKPQLLNEEKQRIEQISGKSVTKSRQHYIRMQLPETYEQLIAAGIAADFSMGYGSINGFRASYCLPFSWYSLKEEKKTALMVYPFCYMDANSFYEQHYSSKQAAEEMLRYAHTVKDVGGLFITIWHNHFLGTDSMFKGWGKAYTEAFASIAGGDIRKQHANKNVMS